MLLRGEKLGHTHLAVSSEHCGVLMSVVHFASGATRRISVHAV